MKAISSSHITAAGYDPDAREMHVTWQTGKRSIYGNVPPEVAEQTLNSWSVGKALIDGVKANPAYSHRYAGENE